MSERPQLRQLEEFSPIDLVKRAELTGELLSRSEEIRVNKISLEYLIVDEGHVETLAHSMNGPRGQISEIVVRARRGGIEESDVGFDVIDGFHRVEAANSLGWETIQAKVLYGCSDEEMYDLRILAANSVRSVKFSRLAFWMIGAWGQTPWREKITLTQACYLTSNNASGKKLGLPPQESEEIKKWVRSKAKKWLIPHKSLSAYFRLIDIAAPDLVKLVRLKEGKSGKGKIGLTPQRLGIIARAFPGDFEFQRQFVNLADNSQVATEELLTIVNEVRALGDPFDTSSVEKILRNHCGDFSSNYEYNPRKSEVTVGQVLGALKGFETYLERYPGLETDEVNEIHHLLWLIKNKIIKK